MAKINYVSSPVKIKVIGLGGAGCNAVTRMVREQIHGVEFIVMNTNAQHLAITEVPTRIQLGEHSTHGIGAGGNHELGRMAAEESRDEIKQAIAGRIWYLSPPVWEVVPAPVRHLWWLR